MYHIFVLLALMTSQNEINQISNSKSNTKSAVQSAERPIPSYPPQPNDNDILDQFRKEIAKEDEALQKVTANELESFALDPVDLKSEKVDDDFLNTPVKRSAKGMSNDQPDGDFASQSSQQSDDFDDQVEVAQNTKAVENPAVKISDNKPNIS